MKRVTPAAGAVPQPVPDGGVGAAIVAVLLVGAHITVAGCGARAVTSVSSQDGFERSHDLGIVYTPLKDGGAPVLEHAFELANSGTSILTLTTQSTSCGCTQPRLPEGGIQPGEKGHVEVVIKPSRNSGAISEWVLLKTSDPKTPNLRLVLSATILPRLETTFNPIAKVRVCPGQTWRHTFQARGRQPLDEPRSQLRLEAPRDDEGLFEARLGPTERRAIDGGYELSTADVEVCLTCPRIIADPIRPGRVQTLRFTFGDASLEQLIVWEPEFPIVAIPREVFLPRKGAAGSSHIVRLQGKEPFSIVELTTTSDEISVDAGRSERSTTHEFRVAASAAELVERPTSKRFGVVVTTDMPEQEVVRLPVFILDSH